LEYAYLVGKHYENDMNQQVANRMLELERLIGLETLVDDQWLTKPK
jgi:hypothetical protein